MPGGSFLDTNVVLYVASSDTAKAERAERLMSEGGHVSVQVLNELTNVARRKMNLSWDETHAFLAMVRALLEVSDVTLETHELGLALAERYGLSTYDAMIVALALLAGCDTLFSEDMQHGLSIEGQLRVVDPFRE